MGIVILGAGMAGLGASYALNQQGHAATIFEKRARPGGHTSSHVVNGGFVVDEGPHVSFTKIERIQKLFAENVNQEFERLQTYVNNYWRGHWVKHPVICNLKGLPTDLVVEIMRDFVAVHGRPTETRSAKHFGDWLIASYGETYARTFPFEYNQKYHTTQVHNLTTDWLGPRLYRASLEEVFRGALEEETADVHYIDHFRYPTRGGFESYLRRFIQQARIEVEREVIRIDTSAKRITFATGRTAEYDALISSIPLPEIVRLIPRAPQEVIEAADRLACSTCYCVTVGIDRPETTNAHWTYFYDAEIIFARTSVPRLFSPHTCPPGTSSIQCEVYFSRKYKPVDLSSEEIGDRVVSDLRRVGLIDDDDGILFRDIRCVPYANIIFDHDRAPSLAVVHGFLEEEKVHYCGRYGDWGYLWTDQSFISGERAARKALEGL
jgi:protoporphyrinogen oxidase